MGAIVVSRRSLMHTTPIVARTCYIELATTSWSIGPGQG